MMFRTTICAFFAIALINTQYAQASNLKNTLNPNDVVGMFAEVGSAPGPRSGEKTVTEAHSYCLRNSISSMSFQRSNAQDINNTNDPSYHSNYKNCMAQFVPFKQEGIDSVGSCPTQTVSWGQCQGTFTAAPLGATVTVKNLNNDNEYEGYASFKCESGTPVYVAGGCSRAVKECASGQIVSWPVTTPLWADESSATEYRDKYGEVIHLPKDRCYARMPFSTSGELHSVSPTTPEMMEPQRYNMAGSTSSQRCFDSKWMPESSGPQNCEYIPKNCAAQSVNHNGCGFSLPASEHDTIYVDNSPSPQGSLGAVEAYCFDGTWKIKARSCQLSCAVNVSPYTWSGSDPRSCQHNGLSQSSRLTPGDHIVIENASPGMIGSVTYRCDNGNLVSLSKPCEPQSCNTVSSANWAGNGHNCNHKEINSNWSHGSNIRVSTETSILVSFGFRGYQCRYGEMIATNEACDGGPIECDNTDPEPPVSCSGVIVDNVCCRVVDGMTVCGNDGGDDGDDGDGGGGGGGGGGAPSSFDPKITYNGSCMHCSQPFRDGRGEMYPYPPITDVFSLDVTAGTTVIVNTGCLTSGTCTSRLVNKSESWISGSLFSSLVEDNSLSSSNTLNYRVTVNCTAYSNRTAMVSVTGEIEVTNTLNNEKVIRPFYVDLKAWCGNTLELDSGG